MSVLPFFWGSMENHQITPAVQDAAEGSARHLLTKNPVPSVATTARCAVSRLNGSALTDSWPDIGPLQQALTAP